MWFRTRYSLHGISVARGERLELDVDGHAVTIWYGKHPNSKSAPKGLFVTSVWEEEPPSDVTAYLTDASETLGTDDGPDPPEAVEGFCSRVTTSNSNAIRRTIELLRWRTGIDGPQRPYASLGSQWSLDQSTWEYLPRKYSFEAAIVEAVRLIPETETLVRTLAATTAQEPVAHHLLREARDVSHSNERSSLVIAVAAVESGFKALAGDLVPDATWLLQSVPAPPLVKMLKEYLPSLPARQTFDGKVHGPPKYVRSLLHTAVETRNAVAHRGVWTMDRSTLKATLNAAGETLYLFDYYAGHNWALQRIGTQYLDGLGT